MNDLEMITSKIVSAREIIDAAVDRIQEHQYDKAELMMSAAYEYLEYYLQEFDEKFKLAWQETVVKQKEEDSCTPSWGHSNLEYRSKHKEPLTCDKDDPNPECKGAWDSFWEENYYPEENQQYTEEELNAMCDVADKKHSKYYYDYNRNDPDRPNPFPQTRWVLPVELDPSGECFVTFPDDLLEAVNLKEGDAVYWIDNKDGSFTLRKSLKPLGPDEC